MKTKCMQSSHKHQQINKSKVPKPNESALIIKLVTSVAPSARPFPSDPPPRAAGVCQSKQEHRFPPPPPRDAAASHRLRLRRRGSWPCVSPYVAAISSVFQWFVTPLWTAKLWNHAPITSHLICITLITTERATLSVNANLLINKLIRQLQLCRRMPKWNMTTQSLSTAPVGLFRCHSEEHDDKVSPLHSQALIPMPGSARL